MKYYTGVGSRNTPTDILNLMTKISIKLDSFGYVLRSGGALGADSAFEKGTNKKEIFHAKDANKEAIKIAKQFHPKWDCCSSYAKKLHGRNSFQVLGKNLMTPSKFLICWTPDGCCSHSERTIQTGGTGTAISIADYYNIPIINLSLNTHYKLFEHFVKR